MKKLLIMGIMIINTTLFAQSFHTITIDGENDFIDGSERMETTSGSNLYGYVTWDEQYLYIGISGNSPWGTVTDNDRNFHIYLDTDPKQTAAEGAGTTDGEAWRWDPALPFTANFHFVFETETNTFRKKYYNSSTSAWVDTNITNSNWKGSGFWELKLKLEDLGDPNQIYLISYVEEDNQGGHICGGLPSNLFTNTSAEGAITFNDHYLNYYLYEQSTPNAAFHVDNFVWLGRITASASTFADTNIYAGMALNATNGFDSGVDIAKPPAPPSNYINIFFDHPDWTTTVLGPHFSRNLKNLISLDSATSNWDFKVDTDQSNQTITLNVSDYDFIPTNYDIKIYDVSADSTHDIKTNGAYQYNSGAKDLKSFKLIVGVTITDQNISPSSDSLNFGSVKTNADSTMNLTITNTGEADLQISNITTGTSIFTFSGGTSFTITSNNSVDIPVKFAPVVSGNFTDTLKISSNDPDTPTLKILLLGTGIALQPNISSSAGAIDFGSIKVDYDSTISFKVYNTGDTLLSVLSITAPAPGFIFNGATAFSVSVDDSVTRSITFTPTQAASYSSSIKIISNDPDTDTLTITLAGTGITSTVETSLTAGWRMFSVPINPQNPYAGSVIGDDITQYMLFGYSGTAGYFSEDTLKIGHGYWLGIENNSTVDVTGAAESEDVSINSNAGWNLSASPFIRAYPKSKVYFRKNSVTLSASAAESDSGWIQNTYYTYDPVDSSYTNNSTLFQWKGYWFLTLTSGVEMLFYHDSTTGDPLKQPEEIQLLTPENWCVNISVSSDNYKDDLLKFGTNENASEGFDIMFDDAEPPMAPVAGAVESYFEHTDWNQFISKFASDIKSPLNGQNNHTWDFKIHISNSGVIKLTWENILEQIPEEILQNYEFSLSGYGMNGEINMLENFSHSFYAEVAAYYDFSINASVTSFDEEQTPYKYQLDQNFPNPFNPSTVINYQLAEEGHVSLSVYNILGKKVIDLVNETQTAGNHSVLFDASGFASGVYLYKITSGEFVGVKKLMLIK